MALVSLAHNDDVLVDHCAALVPPTVATDTNMTPVATSLDDSMPAFHKPLTPPATPRKRSTRPPTPPSKSSLPTPTRTPRRGARGLAEVPTHHHRRAQSTSSDDDILLGSVAPSTGNTLPTTTSTDTPIGSPRVRVRSRATRPASPTSPGGTARELVLPPSGTRIQRSADFAVRLTKQHAATAYAHAVNWLRSAVTSAAAAAAATGGAEAAAVEWTQNDDVTTMTPKRAPRSRARSGKGEWTAVAPPMQEPPQTDATSTVVGQWFMPGRRPQLFSSVRNTLAVVSLIVVAAMVGIFLVFSATTFFATTFIGCLLMLTVESVVLVVPGIAFVVILGIVLGILAISWVGLFGLRFGLDSSSMFATRLVGVAQYVKRAVLTTSESAAAGLAPEREARTAARKTGSASGKVRRLSPHPPAPGTLAAELGGQY
ncbi:hypothetical protein AMAG_00759 [Allomyces macrogynus ATCC 38327]|uniref:Uncharacterized protein n=1 Tax=Allomyces macrogynus (strain ATCC 38327) TaxID=578462 RepID=A0A0L0RWT0_ALLM3|nr:hypothetical protein AMAG_00759 [Allomyces macrogynus ATCC 38327]|eukprot:KNE54808.1 hypothetical protein AMAG_00759 [Allomyces macrogynus ATCC 38327]